MSLPEFQGRMLDFFRNAFQQNQVVLGTLFTNLGVNLQFNNTYNRQIERSIMDSFPLTVWELVKTGQPLNQALTTNQYMLTTAMMSILSYADDMTVADNGKTTNRPNARALIPQFTIDPTSANTLAQSLDSTNATTFMTWNLPMTFTGCATETPYQTTGAGMYQGLMNFLFGRATYPPCQAQGQVSVPAQFAETDFTDYRMVTLNVAGAGANTAPVFYDILKLRAASAMTLHTQRMGFFGTLAFDANWATNVSNEARVTANQSLIVSIGQSINGENVIVNFPVNTTDANHATNPACAGCHSQLDPFKQYFRQSYTLTYHDQTDATQLSQPAGFAIDGVTAQGQGVGDISKTLATHPRFALAWVNKLHFWANSTAAIEDDPEVLRIADAFQKAKFDFKTLARELFSSPLITLASGTKTTQTNGIIMSIARRDQFCAALSNRMGLADVCGMATIKPTQQQTTVATRALLMPVDTYYRAYALPSLPTNPDLFFRDSVESICRLVADQLVDVKPGPGKYDSTKPDEAIADFVATVMALVPSDPRAAAAQQILSDNFAQAKASGATATDSLKATFTLACIAPTSAMVGQ
jgi:hypothetical protein